MLGEGLQAEEQSFRAVDISMWRVWIEASGWESWTFRAWVSSASGPGLGPKAHLVVCVPVWAHTHC